MPRLLDDIRSGALHMPSFVAPQYESAWGRHAQTIGALLVSERDMPVILIDNVSTYFYESSDQEHWDIREHFPNIAPPFPIFWMEHRAPRVIHSKERGDTDVAALVPHGRVGYLFIGAKREDVTGEGIPDNTHWVLTIEVFIDYGPALNYEIQGPHGTVTMAIDEHGMIIQRPYMQSFVAPGDPYLYGLMQSLVGNTHPALLAISFLHCKNVTIVDNPVPPKLAKRYRERHGGVSPTSYKTLVIEPLKEILRREGKSDETGLARALHICRGHFRDYRQGKGLFGKYHTIVWTPAVVRGTKHKDGAVAPREIEIKV